MISLSPLSSSLLPSRSASHHHHHAHGHYHQLQPITALATITITSFIITISNSIILITPISITVDMFTIDVTLSKRSIYPYFHHSCHHCHYYNVFAVTMDTVDSTSMPIQSSCLSLPSLTINVISDNCFPQTRREGILKSSRNIWTQNLAVLRLSHEKGRGGHMTH